MILCNWAFDAKNVYGVYFQIEKNGTTRSLPFSLNIGCENQPRLTDEQALS